MHGCAWVCLHTVSVRANAWIFPSCPSTWNPYRKNCWQCTLPTTREQPKPTFSWAKKNSFNKFFSKELASVGLLFFPFTFYLSLSKAPHQSLSQENTLCVYSCIVGTGKTNSAREAFVKNISSWNLMLLPHQVNLSES